MGDQLLKFYRFVNTELGRKSKVQLTMKTKISITQAAILPDTEENIALFKTAIEELMDQPRPGN